MAAETAVRAIEVSRMLPIIAAEFYRERINESRFGQIRHRGRKQHTIAGFHVHAEDIAIRCQDADSIVDDGVTSQQLNRSGTRFFRIMAKLVLARCGIYRQMAKVQT